MKSHFIRDLEPDHVITSLFIVHAKEVRLKKTGDPYLCLTLADRTGTLDAKMWDNVGPVLDAFDRDDFVKVKGLVQIFKNKPQMTVHTVRRIEDREVDFADYFPHTERNIDEMWAELRAAVAAMRNPHLRALADAFLDDPEIAVRFRRAPAAKSVHHARLGGLLEHVVSLIGLARLAAAHYDWIDADLLLTGVVLHDLGKIYELGYHRSFTYTTEGQLLGHLVLMIQMIHDKAAALPDFPPKLKLLVEHMVLSHHGKYEFGSPKLPMFPEAQLLHYLDDLDSKMDSMRTSLARDQNVEGEWTSYNAALERVLLKKDKFLAGGEPKPAAAASVTSVPEPAAPAPEPAPVHSRPESSRTSFGERLQSALKTDGSPE